MPAATPDTGLSTPVSPRTTAADEVVDICRDLIRFDTSNYGDNEGPGERAAAEHVMGLLTEVGLDPELFESAPGSIQYKSANAALSARYAIAARPTTVDHLARNRNAYRSDNGRRG